MDVTTKSCREFVEMVGSSSPAPGGGGAAAVVGAIGVALGNMITNLTVDRMIKAENFGDDYQALVSVKNQFDALQTSLLDCVEADEIGFMPLAEAYKIPKDTPGRDETMEKAKVSACGVPLKIMEMCCEALDSLVIVSQKGSRIALSDAGCAAACCKAALQSASLNVYTNTKTMKNRLSADELNRYTNLMMNKGGRLADLIFRDIEECLKKERCDG